jgi:hypothetical protein
MPAAMSLAFLARADFAWPQENKVFGGALISGQVKALGTPCKIPTITAAKRRLSLNSRKPPEIPTPLLH